MLVRMLETRAGSPDHIRCEMYSADEMYDLPDHLAIPFLEEGWAVLRPVSMEAETEEQDDDDDSESLGEEMEALERDMESKDLGAAPENKGVGGRKRRGRPPGSKNKL